MANSFTRLFLKIGEINRRYRTPRLAMSRGVRITLMVLRLYLLFLVSLMVYKFILLLH
jgi:hypothetical protein